MKRRVAFPPGARIKTMEEIEAMCHPLPSAMSGPESREAALVKAHEALVKIESLLDRAYQQVSREVRQAKAEGAAEERARVVAWLTRDADRWRNNGDFSETTIADEIDAEARAIERGDHAKEGG